MPPVVDKSIQKSDQSGTIYNNHDDSLNTVREILLGSKVKEQNEKFEHLQQKIQLNLSTIRSECLDRIGTLEKYIKEELKAIGHSMKDEKSEHEKAIAKQSKALSEIHQEIEERLNYLSADNSKATSEVRSFVLSCTKELSEEFHSVQKKSLDEISKEIVRINQNTVTRMQFVEFLSDWTLRLSDAKMASKLN